MRKAFLASAFMLVGLVGCGGGGADTIQNSPFAGQWAGSYNTSGSTGSVSITVTGNGRVAGSGHNSTSGFDFALNGEVDNTGSFNGDLSGGTSGHVSGLLVIGLNGHLQGTVTQTSSGLSTSGSFNLTRQ